MPAAFSITYGLDLDTQVSSFWSWLHDVREALATGSASKQALDLVESQREQIERSVAGAKDPEQARETLTVALALVGFHYASQQKLLNGLKDLGLLDRGAAGPYFDTIVEPPVDEDLRPR